MLKSSSPKYSICTIDTVIGSNAYISVSVHIRGGGNAASDIWVIAKIRFIYGNHGNHGTFLGRCSWISEAEQGVGYCMIS